MLRKLHINFFILTTVIMLFGRMNIQAQEEVKNILDVSGVVTDENGKKLKDVTVTLYNKRSGEKLGSVKTGKDGLITNALDFDMEWILEFKKKGYITKKIQIDTRMKGQHEDYYGFEYTLILSSKVLNDFAPELLDKPVVSIYYKPNKKDFGHDSLYYSSVRKELQRLTPEMRSQLSKQLEHRVTVDDNPSLAAKADKDFQNMLARMDEDNKKYSDIIKKGDAAMAAKNYPDAKTAYTEALVLRPNEKYPKDKLDAIQKIMDASVPNTAQQKDQLYKDLITKADADLKAKKYDDAEDKYTQASMVKPAEKYPKDKLAEIAKIKQAEADKKYKSLIAKADQEFTGKKYAEARADYQSALDLKPNEKHPKDRIAAIDKMSGGDQKYKDLIAKADKDFKAKNHLNAKVLYQEAAKLKPNEKYPKDKIAEIDRIMREVADGLRYSQLIDQADTEFEKKNYAKSKSLYINARDMKPVEKYPKDQIVRIDKLLKGGDAEQKYTDYIAKADKKFDEKKYAEARTLYQKASDVKPSEKYPKDKIVELDKLIEQLAKANTPDEVKKTLEEIENAMMAKGKSAKDLTKEERAKYELLANKYQQSKQRLEAMKRKAENDRVKMKNIETKYLTGNPLTSLYDVTDSVMTQLKRNKPVIKTEK